jgi:hypothetical protein
MIIGATLQSQIPYKFFHASTFLSERSTRKRVVTQASAARTYPKTLQGSARTAEAPLFERGYFFPILDSKTVGSEHERLRTQQDPQQTATLSVAARNSTV